MKTDIREGDRSTIVLQVEITAQELQQAIDEGVRHLARRTRIPGFRPGKAPRNIVELALGIDRSDPEAPDPVHDEAREHLYERTAVRALAESGRDILELPREPEWLSFAEGQGATYAVTLPVRPEVSLGDFTAFPFEPAVDEVTEDQVDAVVEQLRDQQAALVPVEDRGAQTEDFAVISFEGRRDGEPVEGAASERFPLVIGKERMIPGFEANLIGMREGEERTFSVTFPDDYGEDALAGQEVQFTASIRELRERRLPAADDDFAGLVGPYEGMAALRADLRERLRVSSLDRARHLFADRVIEYATANATVAIPDILVDREVAMMLDELRVRTAQQGIRFEDYLRVTEKTEDGLREEYRDAAEHRVKVLLVLGAIAEREAVEVPDADVEAEIANLRADGSTDRSLTDYLDTDSGRDYVRSQLRRSAVVEGLVDRWIEAHPQYAQVQHQHQPHRHEEGEAASLVDAIIEEADEDDVDDDELAAIEAAVEAASEEARS